MRRIKKFVLVVGPLGLVACASVWGFEDAKDGEGRDGGGSTDGGGGGPDIAVDTTPAATGDVTPSNVPDILCAPRPPDGWIGPLAVAEGTGSPLPPLAQCQERWDPAYELNANITVPNTGCGCDCDPTPVKDCQVASATLWSEATCTTTCGGAAQAVSVQPPETCSPFNPGGNCAAAADIWIKTGDATPSGGCTPKSKGPPGAPGWLTAARLCKPKADAIADCGDKAIAPQPPIGFEKTSYCVVATKPDNCPSAYPVKRPYVEPDKFAEERTCAACSCGAPSGKCSGVVQTGDSTSGVTGDCGGGDKFLPPPVACVKLGKHRVWGYGGADAASNVQCTPSGGAIMGNVVPATTLTVCCRNTL